MMLGIAEEVTMENVRETLMKQNMEINLNDRILERKFCYKKRRNRNLVIEVDSSNRIKILQSRVKMGWTVCKLDDYIAAKRYFRCSLYNHSHRVCKGEEASPLCAGNHKLKACISSTSDYKCVNCMIYNKHHPTNQMDTPPSSLDKQCPSLIAVLAK
jgi:hypothetical protein